jgi:hypothetical protein
MHGASKVTVVALLFCLAVFYTKHLRGEAMEQYLGSRPYENVYYLPPPDWLPILSVGYREVLADLLWIKALIYFGDEVYHRSEARHIFDYADAILALDERFKAVYHWVSSCALYRPAQITVDDAKKAISYLEKGVKLFPSDGDLAWDLGATYSYELAPMLDNPAQKLEAKRKGLEQLQFAVLRGSAPPWLVLSNASMLTKLGRTEQAIRHLEEMYSTVTDSGLREQIAKKLGELRTASFTEAFTQAVSEFEKARRRDFPFVSPGLYWHLGTRPPFDGLKFILNNFDPVES